jgi:hypothetical protein
MRLIFTSGPREGEAVDVDGTGVMIGRVDDNDLQIPDEKVSRHHAVIELEGGRAVLRDLRSRNGTYVDGLRLSSPRTLRGGERLRLGDEELRVELTSAPAPPAPAAPAPAAHAAPGPVQAVPVEPAPVEPAGGAGSRTRRTERWSRRRILSVSAAVVLLALLVIGQFVLPGVGERSLRSDLAAYGPVRHVNVESFPAVKLLAKRADRVDVTMDSYRSEPGGHGSLADFLSRTRTTKKLDARVGTVDAQLLTLHDVRLHKDGDVLVGQGRLSQQELRDALPTFVGIKPVSASENGIVLRAKASALGHTAAVNLRVLADGGEVVVQPDDFPFGGLASVHVFNDPRVYVESLGAELRGNQYRITARARLE